MLRKILLWVLLVLCFGFLLCGGESWMLQRSISEKTLRLHVVGKSDSDLDQLLKLRVRNHILSRLAEEAVDCHGKEELMTYIRDHETDLSLSSQQLLEALGCKASVSVSLSKETFPMRSYHSFCLPAGDYDALRIVIGEGEGRNWWCVIFPSLCMAATGEALSSCAAFGGYEEEEIRLIQGQEPKYELRFKLLDWLSTLFSSSY